MLMEPPPPPVPAPDPTVHRHEGFYLRMGLGIGMFWASAKPPFGAVSARGMGPSFDLAIGGTPADGLVIGGALSTSLAGRVHWRGDALVDLLGDDETDGGAGLLQLLGVFIDYYPNPAGGLHFQGALGIGTMSFQPRTSGRFPSSIWSGGGGGVLLGGGYDAFVSKQWSMGGLLRVLLIGGTLRPESTRETFAAKGIAPSLVFTATLH